MNKAEIKWLLSDLEFYINKPNQQDINGEYDPPLELTQDDAKIIVDYIKDLQHHLEEKNKIIDEIKNALITYKNEWVADDEVVKDINKFLEILERGKNDN